MTPLIPDYYRLVALECAQHPCTDEWCPAICDCHDKKEAPMPNLFPSIDAKWFRDQLAGYFDSDMPDVHGDLNETDRHGLSVHLAGNLAMKLQAEAMRCPECGEISVGDDRVLAGMKCGVCSYA